MNRCCCFIQLWSAPAKRSGDGAFPITLTNKDPKRRRRSALPAHSKLSRRHRRLNPSRRFDKTLAPQFKRQQGPEQFAMIRNAAFMLVQ